MKTPAFWPTLLLVILLIAAVHLSPVYAAAQPGDYLNYQEPKPAGTSWFSTLAYMFSLLITFIVVIGLAYFTSRFVGQKMGKTAASSDNKVILTLPLGANRGVYVVEVAGKFLVLGVTDHNINLTGNHRSRTG